MPTPPSSNNPFRQPFLIFLGLALGSLLILFYQQSTQALVAMDAVPSWSQGLQYALTHGFWDLWNFDYWLGYRYATVSPDLNQFILRWVDFPLSLNFLYSCNILLGGVGMYLLLRSMGLRSIACIIGGLSYLLSSEVVTLVYPGHVNKVMTYAWIPFAVMSFLAGMRNKNLPFFSFAGAFLGLSLLAGEVQIPVYLGFWFVVWTFLETWNLFRSETAEKKSPRGKMVQSFQSWLMEQLMRIFRHGEIFKNRLSVNLLGLVIVMLCSQFIGASTTLHAKRYLDSNAPVAKETNPSENWLFATQFFFPPEETLSYVTTIQFFGAPAAYWGRDGTPTSIRLSDDYMGLLPLGLAILGGVACWRIWQARFFVIMGLGSLLISFGREGGIFWILYHLPTMKSQRNPHRWSYFVAFAVCVLAAYGVDWLSKQFEGTTVSKNSWKRWRQRLGILALAGGFLFFGSLFLSAHPETAAKFHYSQTDLSSPNAPLYLERARMLVASLVRTGLFLMLSALSVWLLLTDKLNRKLRIERWGWAALVGVLVFDLGANARQFILFYPWEDHFLNNPLVSYLKQDKELFRIKVIGTNQSQLLNDLVTNILPFHHLQVVDPPAVSRLPVDYAELFDYFKKHYTLPEHYLDFFNVKYVIAPGPIDNPSAHLTKVSEAPGFFLYRRDTFMPRAWLVQSVEIVHGGSEDVLARTLHPSHAFRDSAILEVEPQNKTLIHPPADVVALKAIPHPALNPPSVTRYENNVLEVETDCSEPALLVLSEKWDADWKALVDEKPAPILKANFLMRAVELPPGMHRIHMEYRPETLGVKISLAAIACFVLAGLAFYWTRRARAGFKPSE